jgi:pimeloyl-ACP methyl ester carboxylesterase
MDPQSGFVQMDGFRLHYLQWGEPNRPPVVCLHGYTGNAHAWQPVAPELARHFRVIAPDLRGHGDSDQSPDGYSIRKYVADLGRFVDRLGLDRFDLIGLSMGGRVAMVYAAENPGRVGRLVIVDIGPQISRRWSQRQAEPEPDSFASVEEVAERLRRGNPYLTAEYALFIAGRSLKQRSDGRYVWKWDPALRQGVPTSPEIDYWAVLGQVACPTLVLRGEDSPVLDQDVAEQMVRTLSNGRLRVIHRAIHTLQEDNPAEFLAAVKEFLGVS